VKRSRSTTLPPHEEVVLPEWIDSNGHMNLAYYVVIFDHATDLVFDTVDIGAAYRARTGNSCFVVETHTLYEQEVREGERVVVMSRVLGVDAKRLHLFHEMFRPGGGKCVAAQEIMCLHVDMGTRRAMPWPVETRLGLEEVVRASSAEPLPQGVGRRIAMG
jgi:acyl-CoA thioester hydrolase